MLRQVGCTIVWYFIILHRALVFIYYLLFFLASHSFLVSHAFAHRFPDSCECVLLTCLQRIRLGY